MSDQAEPGSKAPWGGVQWDIGAMRTLATDIATVSTATDEVVLNFGRVVTRDGAQGMDLLQRIGLRPLTARHLHDMLSKLIAEADARANQPR